MPEECCTNAGPLIHLHEIGRLEALKVFQKIYLPEIILEQATSSGRANRTEIEILNVFDVQKVSKKSVLQIRESIETLTLDLHEGELEALALCKEKGCSIFLTDDLDARDAAKILGLEPHGSVGVLVRAYNNELMNLDQTKESILDLFEKSSLFITKAIVNQVVEELEKQVKREK